MTNAELKEASLNYYESTMLLDVEIPAYCQLECQNLVNSDQLRGLLRPLHLVQNQRRVGNVPLLRAATTAGRALAP